MIEDYNALYEARSEDEVEAALADLVLEECGDYHTFEGAGVMTYNRGVVFRTADGAEYQLTIVRSRNGSREES